MKLPEALVLVSDAVCKQIPTAVLSANPGSTRVTVRLTPQKHHYLADAQQQLDAALRKVKFYSSALAISFLSTSFCFFLDSIVK